MSRSSSVDQLLGLARRAGALVHGTEAVRQSIRDGAARLVLFAGDASPTQLDKIRRTLETRPTPQATLGDRATLGSAIGLAPVSAVAVTSTSLASRISAELGDAVSVRGAVAAAVAAEE